MKQMAAFLFMVIGFVLFWEILSRLSSDAVAMLVGAIVAVVAPVPMLLMVVVANRSVESEAQRRAYIVDAPRRRQPVPQRALPALQRALPALQEIDRKWTDELEAYYARVDADPGEWEDWEDE